MCVGGGAAVQIGHVWGGGGSAVQIEHVTPLNPTYYVGRFTSPFITVGLKNHTHFRNINSGFVSVMHVQSDIHARHNRLCICVTSPVS